MASKFDGDVRPLSNDQKYMGVVFSGSMKNAIKQAKAAPDHGLAEQYVPAGMSRNRAVLLEHLNLLPKPAPAPKAKEPGFYTLAYAQKHFPESFYRAPDADQGVADRMANLSEAQLRIYLIYRLHNGVRVSLDKAEAYPYPAAQS